MCCSTTVKPVTREVAEAILALGMFVPTYTDGNEYVRSIPEEGTKVTATFR